jgi:uncharacterized membrane protein YhaH (DUF805 family)
MLAQYSWFFLSLKGRISRQEFWLGYLLILSLAALVIPRLQTLILALRRPVSGPWYRDELATALMLPRLAVVVAVVWPLTALLVKRLHDLGLSGWWLLAFIGALWLMMLTGVEQKNYLGMILLAILGLMPGKRSDNRFGVDPVG